MRHHASEVGLEEVSPDRYWETPLWPDGRPTGSDLMPAYRDWYREVGLGEPGPSNAEAGPRFREGVCRDRYGGICSELLVTREQRGSVELVRSSNECIGDFESTEEALGCPDFRVTAWALCLDLPASIRRLPN